MPGENDALHAAVRNLAQYIQHVALLDVPLLAVG